MYPRIWSYYGRVGRVYCDYCRTFLMTEAKRKQNKSPKFNHVHLHVLICGTDWGASLGLLCSPIQAGHRYSSTHPHYPPANCAEPINGHHRVAPTITEKV